jgi:hypothetical protein
MLFGGHRNPQFVVAGTLDQPSDLLAARSTVTSKKNLNPVIAALTDIGETPVSTR